MTLYEMIKKYGEGKGESTMWSSVCSISKAVDSSMPEEAKHSLMREVYASMSGHHYNQEFAMEDVAKMYYIGEDKKAHHAPYWTVEQVSNVFDGISGDIPDYNFWDFYVTLQMVKADNCPLIMRWFDGLSGEEMDEKFVEMAVNWLNDPDSPNAGHKIWSYLN